MIRNYLYAIGAIFLAVITGFIIYVSIFMESPRVKAVEHQATPIPFSSEDEGVSKMAKILEQHYCPNQAFLFNPVENAVTTFFEGEPIVFRVRGKKFVIQRINAGLEICRYIKPAEESELSDYFIEQIPPTPLP